MRKTSIAENWSAVEELRMVISRVGEERRTLEAQLGKVNWKHFPILGGTVNIMEDTLILTKTIPADGGSVRDGSECGGAGFEDGSPREGRTAA